MNSYLTVITSQTKIVGLWNASRPLLGEPVDIGITGFTVRVTGDHPTSWLIENSRLDARPVRMVTPEQAAKAAERRVIAEYGAEALEGIDTRTLVDMYATANSPARVLDYGETL